MSKPLLRLSDVGRVLLLAMFSWAAVHSAAAVSAEYRHEGGVPLLGASIGRILFPNPYAHIPAQCYIETSGGAQNACQFCHTDGPYKAGLGNSRPQGGASEILGNLQAECAFVALSYPRLPNGSINHWRNTLFSAQLEEAVRKLDEEPETWDMQAYIRQDNWGPAFSHRPGDARSWDAGVQHAFRLFPGLDPADLPADADGFVRSKRQGSGLFRDGEGWITGWRSLNFVPYGIFTPHTGSLNGIYTRRTWVFGKARCVSRAREQGAATSNSKVLLGGAATQLSGARGVHRGRKLACDGYISVCRRAS